jgi:hypothetical protein
MPAKAIPTTKREGHVVFDVIGLIAVLGEAMISKMRAILMNRLNAVRLQQIRLYPIYRCLPGCFSVLSPSKPNYRSVDIDALRVFD